MKYKPIDFVPEGSRLTFINKTKNGNAIYSCKCGNNKEIRMIHVRSGAIKSCGCYKNECLKNRVWTDEQKRKVALVTTTHGLRRHPLYSIYADIKRRCENVNCLAYPDYGGRGVKMCDEWKENPQLFINWAIENGWRKGLDVDKDVIPKKLGIPSILYSPEMCSIITRKENNNARRSNTIYTMFGRNQTLSQWCDEYKIKSQNVLRRLKLGWPIEKALTTPIRTKWKQL